MSGSMKGFPGVDRCIPSGFFVLMVSLKIEQAPLYRSIVKGTVLGKQEVSRDARLNLVLS